MRGLYIGSQLACIVLASANSFSRIVSGSCFGGLVLGVLSMQVLYN